jgi:hypothetical protein
VKPHRMWGLKNNKLPIMRRYAPLSLLLVLAACGEAYNPPPLYLATSPDCGTLLEADTFPLPSGITVSATNPIATADGGIDIGVNYMLPRTTQLKFATVGFPVTHPKGALIETAQVASVFQRPTNQRAEIVEIVHGVPQTLIAVGTSDQTQFRYRLHLKGKLPPRFDLVTPDVVVDLKRYESRVFTYRWVEEKKAYSMCR